MLEALAALYRDADALYAQWSCPSSTECCRFGITGRQPYVTSIEVAALERARLQRGLPALTGTSRKRARQARTGRALPITQDPDREQVCPLLDARQRCSVYEARPLGCRTFYCERASRGEEPGREALRVLLQRLRELAARHAPEGELARPLLRVLGGE